MPFSRDRGAAGSRRLVQGAKKWPCPRTRGRAKSPEECPQRSRVGSTRKCERGAVSSLRSRRRIAGSGP